MRKLQKCFWRFPETKGLIDSIVDKIEFVSAKRKREQHLTMQSIESQFNVLCEKVNEHKAEIRKLVKHLAGDREIRDRLAKTKLSVVSDLIKDYEKQPLLSDEMMDDFESKQYSGVIHEMHQLEINI